MVLSRHLFGSGTLLVFSPLVATRLIGTLVKGGGRLVGAPDLHLKEVRLLVAALAAHRCRPHNNWVTSGIRLIAFKFQVFPVSVFSTSCAPDLLTCQLLTE